MPIHEELQDISGYGRVWDQPESTAEAAGTDAAESAGGHVATANPYERSMADVTGGELGSSSGYNRIHADGAGSEPESDSESDSDSDSGYDLSQADTAGDELDPELDPETGYDRRHSDSAIGAQEPAVPETAQVRLESEPSAIEDEDEEEDEPVEQVNERGLITKKMDSLYEGEQQSAHRFRGRAQNWNDVATTPGANFSRVKTNYLRPEEQAQAAVDVENGKLMRGGAPLDTRAASGTGTLDNGAEGKHIFAMSPDAQVRSIDAWGAHTEKKNDSGNYELGMVNHSSLAAVQNRQGEMVSGRAAAAGEIAAENGKLTQVTDASGHYKPHAGMTRQALNHFLNKGVDMHDVALKLTDKEGGENHLHASAREFMLEDDPAKAEANMRGRRDRMRGDLEKARAGFEKRQASGQMNLKGRQVAATPALLDPRTKAPRMKKAQDLIGLFEGMY